MNIFRRIAKAWRDFWDYVNEDDEAEDADGYPDNACLFCGGHGDVIVNSPTDQKLMTCPVCRGTGKVQ